MSTLPSIPGIRIDRLVGVGGMGALYAGYDDRFHREVAVKVLLSDAPSASAHRRFEREARGMLAIDHPHVCRAFDYGRMSDGSLYLVLELLRGLDLGAWITAHGPLSYAEVVRVGR